MQKLPSLDENISLIQSNDTFHSVDFDGALNNRKSMDKMNELLLAYFREILEDGKSLIPNNIKIFLKNMPEGMTEAAILERINKDNTFFEPIKMGDHQKCLESFYLKKQQQIKEAYEVTNAGLIEKINGAPVLQGSNRYSLLAERQSCGTGYSAPAFMHTFKGNLITILMPDVASSGTFDTIMKFSLGDLPKDGLQKNQFSLDTDSPANTYCDEQKLVLIYSQAHTIAKHKSGIPFTLNFYDDNPNIVLRLQQHYGQNPKDLPAGCTLKIHWYAPDYIPGKDILMEFKEIKGTGKCEQNLNLEHLRKKDKEWNNDKDATNDLSTIEDPAEVFLALEKLANKPVKQSTEQSEFVDANNEQFEKLADMLNKNITRLTKAMTLDQLTSLLSSFNTLQAILRNIPENNPKREDMKALWVNEINAVLPSQDQPQQDDHRLEEINQKWSDRKQIAHQANVAGILISYDDLRDIGTVNTPIAVLEKGSRVRFNKIKTAFAGLSALLGTGGMIAGGILATGFLFGTGGIGALALVFLALLILAPLMVLRNDIKEQKERGLDYFSAKKLEMQAISNESSNPGTQTTEHGTHKPTRTEAGENPGPG